MIYDIHYKLKPQGTVIIFSYVHDPRKCVWVEYSTLQHHKGLSYSEIKQQQQKNFFAYFRKTIFLNKTKSNYFAYTFEFT